ncbi:MAG: DUF3016 domain-containing protein [Verrucomicrobiota bacterium]
MKSMTCALTSLSLLLAYGLQANETQNLGHAETSVSVVFVDPENFTDVQSAYGNLEETCLELARSIQTELEQQVRDSFGKGAVLSLVVSDIDRAGRLSNIGIQNIRILKTALRPKITFSYIITGADTEVIARGIESLDDQKRLGFDTAIAPDGPFGQECAMLAAWLSDLKASAESAVS